MSLRFNPVAFLTRRRSRSKSKTRTKPGTTSGSPPGQNNGLGQQETAIEPHITTKLARTSGTSPRRTSPRPYFRVFSSFRRTRSPRRPNDTKNVDSTARAESVPPGRSSPLVFESNQPAHTQETQAADDGSKSPAPLAQSDCFELTDVSDPEVEEVSARMRQHNAQESLPERSTEDDSEQVDDSSRSETDIQSVIERTESQDFDEEKSIDESTKYEKSEDEDEDTCIDTPDTAVYDDEQSVTKLSVEYETEYPVCERDSDSTISAHGSQLGDEWVVTDEKEKEKSSSSEEDERSDFHISSSEQSSHEQEEEDSQEREAIPSLTVQLSQEEIENPEIKLESVMEEEFEIHKTSPEEPSNLEQIETDLDYQNGSHPQHEESGSCDEDTPSVHEENGEVDYMEPQFEVTHDPAQDPFHEVELAATERSWDNGAAAAFAGVELSVPSIIVTSASSLSLNQQAESEPPERPPPPAVAPPQRPPPPPTGPPPRPPGSPTHGHTGETGKKRKLFGVVDVGPLPSDPDPNFPFRKHLEKSIVPNPKKAIQRIIRGETKAERRQRKEQDELNRLLKSKANADVKPVDAHSKDWEFFQELTAQIEHTVQESASKVRVLLPSKPHPLEVDDEEEEDQGEDWAHFDSAFGSETEPAAVQTFNPWEDKIKPSEVSEEFDLEPEGTEAVLHDGDMTDTLVQIADEPEHSGLNEEEHQSLTDLERDLGTEVVSEDTATGLTKDIDTFLGIEAANEPDYQEPLSSDPLQVLECLKPKNEVDPLEELGLDLSPSAGMATDVVNDPRDLALADFSSDVQQGSEHSPAESLDSSGPNQLQQSDTNQLSDDAELNEHETQYEDTSSKKQAIELPYQEDMDRSDVEDSTAVDDVLWGGFGEIHVEPNGHVGSEPDPFGFDDFGSAVVNSGNGAQPGSRKEANLYEQPSKDAIRPRAKPVRQETLSGNNPFRKRTSEDNEPDDELIRAAASIGLIGLQHPVRKHRDSFESSGSSVVDDNLVNEQRLQAAGESAEECLTDDVDHIENAKVPTHGFDPLQTIYPESDNESVASEEQTQTENQAISITIKDKPEVLNEDQTRSSPEVPTLTAPPRPQPVAVESKQVEPELISVNAEATDEPVARHPTPVGWVNFNSESAEILDETDKQLVPAELTFEVDWSAPVMPPQRTEPEPPRPDTPDPELDIPFYPTAKDGAFYRLWLRYPEKKTRIKQVSKYTTDRYWREIAICFRMEHGRKVIDLHEIDDKSDVIASEPYRSIRIEPYMQLSREKLQQYDKYGKLHVFKLNHVTYREMVGIRPEKFSIKSLQNLVTHKPKQNVAVDHLPVYTEILKFGSLDQKKIRELMCVFEDALMQIPAHKDTSLTYNREEVCCYVVDEYQAHVSAEGIIKEQKARTRILCTAFVNGGPHIVLGLNDKWRYGREVVRRSDILPVMHDEWISIRCPEFHSCVELDAYEVDHMLKFFPLDGCRFELLRFRVSLRGNKELPMQVRTTYGIDGRRVSMRCELLVPGFFSASNRKGAVACENVEIHIPVPEDWIYHFRVEKHHKYGSVHSTLRKPGRIKGLERITQMAQSLLPPSILEASIGLAKYEHLYKAIVWRIPRIPEKHEASLRPHLLTCKLTLAQHDTVPEWDTLIPECQVEYTMPSSTVSGATVRSISVEHTGVAEKFVKYTSKYKYTVDIDYHLGERKEPPLKSMLDDQESPVEQEIEEPSHVQTPVAEEQVAQPQGTEVADLLGLGFGFSDLSDNQTTDSKEPQETPGSADLL